MKLNLNIKVCNTFISRFKGLMFKRNIKKGILLKNCNSIHTFFMFSKIDVIMVDKNNIVKYLYNDFKPWRIILPKKNIKNIYELPTGSIKKLKIKLNIKIEDI